MTEELRKRIDALRKNRYQSAYKRKKRLDNARKKSK